MSPMLFALCAISVIFFIIVVLVGIVIFFTKDSINVEDGIMKKEFPLEK